MLIAVLALLGFVLFLICCFLHIDVKRAVTAKEAWKEAAIASDKDRKVLGDRGARLMSVIQTNNAHYQELSDKLEDAELALAFEKERGVNDERAIKYWRAEWQTALDAWREERLKLIGRLGRLSTLDVRNNTIGALLEMPKADRDRVGALAERTKEVVDDLRATRGLLDVASEEIQVLVTARDEATALLVKSQEEAAELAKEREDLIEQRNLGNNELCTVLEAIREKAHLFAIGVGVRQYAAEQGVALTVSSGMDTVASALDDMKTDLESRAERLRAVIRERDRLIAAAIKPTRGPAEDIAPPAKRPRLNKRGRVSQPKRVRA